MWVWQRASQFRTWVIWSGKWLVFLVTQPKRARRGQAGLTGASAGRRGQEDQQMWSQNPTSPHPQTQREDWSPEECTTDQWPGLNVAPRPTDAAGAADKIQLRMLSSSRDRKSTISLRLLDHITEIAPKGAMTSSQPGSRSVMDESWYVMSQHPHSPRKTQGAFIKTTCFRFGQGKCRNEIATLGELKLTFPTKESFFCLERRKHRRSSGGFHHRKFRKSLLQVVAVPNQVAKEPANSKKSLRIHRRCRDLRVSRELADIFSEASDIVTLRENHLKEFDFQGNPMFVYNGIYGRYQGCLYGMNTWVISDHSCAPPLWLQVCLFVSHSDMI